MKPFQIICFIAIAAADLYMVVNHLPRYWTKPLIMLSLFVFSVIQLKGKLKEHILFLIAQCFAFFGDVFLLGSGSQYFIFGLASFLMTHILYAYVFYQQKGIGVHKHRFSIGLIILISCLFLANLLPYTAELMVPVIFYNLSIVGMAIFAVLRWKVKGYYFVVFGALLFMISDATLGYSKFVDRLSYSGFIVMLTYCFAQLFIAHGYLSPYVSEK